MNRYVSTAILAGAVLLGACEKNAVQSLDGPTPTARIKFFNFGVNTPSVNFYANDKKVTAVVTTQCSPLPTTEPLRSQCEAAGAESTNGVASGAAASGGLYNAIDPGAYTFSGRISAATDKDLPIASVQTTIADGKSYSYYISGFYDAATKKAEAFVVEDVFPAEIDFGTVNASVRFVNAISNSQPLILYAKNTTTGQEVPIGGAVAYKAAGAFTPLPSAIYDLSARTAGSATNLFVRTAVTFVVGRVYTVTARGDITVTSTTATTRPQFDVTLNR